MASDAIRRRTKQQSLPMIHFYEQFIKNASARKAASATAAKTNNSIDTTSPTAQLSLDSHYQRYRDRSMSSDTTARIGMYSPDTLTTRSTIAVREKLEFRKNNDPSTLSPLTPREAEQSNHKRWGRKSSRPLEAHNNNNNNNNNNNSNSNSNNYYYNRRTMLDTQKSSRQDVFKTPQKRLTLYERSQLHLKEREKKIQMVRDEMMQECTFRPNTSSQTAIKKGQGKYGKSDRNTATAKKRDASMDSGPRPGMQKSPQTNSTPGSTEATTPTTTSSTRQYWQNLQRKQQQDQQQQQQQQQPQNQQQKSAASATASKDGSLPSSKVSSTTKSSRFEELYQDGVRKARQRPATEKAEQELRRKRLEDEELKECTFRPKTHWGKKLAASRRQKTRGSSGQSSSLTGSRIQQQRRRRKVHRSMSPRRKIPVSSNERWDPPPYQRKVDPILPAIDLSPIQTSEGRDQEEEQSCAGSLSLLRKHHDIMRGRSRRAHSPVPPLPLEIITTGMAAVSPVRKNWKSVLYSSRDRSISPLRGPMLGIEIDAEDEQSPMAPRIIFCGTTVGGESEAAQTQRTEYGSI